MSDAYRGDEEAARARLESLREELTKRKARLAAQSEIVENETANDAAVVGLVVIPWVFCLVGAAICFAFEKPVFGVICSCAVIFVGFRSRLFASLVKQLSAQLKELPHVSEFEEPRLDEPAPSRRQRVEIDDAEIAKQKAELDQRRIACEEIEQEIAENEEILRGRTKTK